MDLESTPAAVHTTSTFAIQCLGTFDILCEVLRHMSRSSQDRPKSALASIARTCKAFTEPALDLLWRELTALLPLLKLLPAMMEASGVYMLLRPLHAADFARFDYYGARVRSVKITNPENSGLDSSIFVRLAREHTGAILPHLESVHISSRANVDSALMLLCSPSVRLVHFETDPECGRVVQSAPFLAFLAVAAQFTPLTVDTLALEGLFIPQILGTIASFRTLQRLDLRGVSSWISHHEPFIHCLNAISAAAHLTALVLRDIPEHSLDLDDLTSAQWEFPMLKELDIVATFGLIDHFVSQLQTPSMHEMSLSFTDGPQFHWGISHQLDEWTRLFNNICCRWNSSLERIRLELADFQVDIQSVFQEFCSIPNLREFTVLDDPSLGILDQDLIDLPISWPNIEILRIQSRGSRSPLQVLAGLADNCPSLVHLEITLDIDADTPTETPRPKMHGLQSITISNTGGRLSTRKSLEVAKFLDTLFPHLASVGGGGDWDDVHDLVKFRQDARADERSRFAQSNSHQLNYSI
ncbi:hypothetical protein FB451DRAFT_1557344 [Mycena latifolia]|nr:hypothetical protein FB451DRAFT_1557344 [Mycena latifolia]